jgi:hypothetical protein
MSFMRNLLLMLNSIKQCDGGGFIQILSKILGFSAPRKLAQEKQDWRTTIDGRITLMFN